MVKLEQLVAQLCQQSLLVAGNHFLHFGVYFGTTGRLKANAVKERRRIAESNKVRIFNNKLSMNLNLEGVTWILNHKC